MRCSKVEWRRYLLFLAIAAIQLASVGQASAGRKLASQSRLTGDSCPQALSQPRGTEVDPVDAVVDEPRGTQDTSGGPDGTGPAFRRGGAGPHDPDGSAGWDDGRGGDPDSGVEF